MAQSKGQKRERSSRSERPEATGTRASAAKTVRGKAAAKAPRVKTTSERLADVIAERDQLRDELARAKNEIDQLMERQLQVLNRIDWILDSLNSLDEES